MSINRTIGYPKDFSPGTSLLYCISYDIDRILRTYDITGPIHLSQPLKSHQAFDTRCAVKVDKD